MANEVLNAEEAQLVVDGLLLGYKEYLDIRKEMKEKLKVLWLSLNQVEKLVYLLMVLAL